MGNVFDRSLDHLHPRLAAIVPLIQSTYAERHPGYRLVVAETRRSVEEQAKRFAEGSTKCDGARSFSMHNFPISYALDLWAQASNFGAWNVKWEKQHYDILGAIVHDLAVQGHPLEWGGDFKGFFDGPHTSLTKAVLHADLQRALSKAGHSLVADGAWGPKSQAAAKVWMGGDDGRASPALYQRLLDAGCVEVG